MKIQNWILLAFATVMLNEHINAQCFYAKFAGQKFETVECMAPGCNPATGICGCKYTYTPASGSNKAKLVDAQNKEVDYKAASNPAKKCKTKECCPNCGHDVTMHNYPNN